MRYLIIGSGNMGKRHGSILEKMEQEVDYADIEFDARDYSISDWHIYDSVLICTPADTHVDLINKVPADIPVFCEKPLLVNTHQIIIPRQAPTLMASNWLFCNCIIKQIHSNYRSQDPYRLLDIIHFMPLYPNSEVIATGNAVGLISNSKGEWPWDARITFWPKYHFTVTHGKRIHEQKFCNMFERQMEHWLGVVMGKEESRRDFIDAEKDNVKLLKKALNKIERKV